jgi:hypothetical protein
VPEKNALNLFHKDHSTKKIAKKSVVKIIIKSEGLFTFIVPTLYMTKRAVAGGKNIITPACP